MIKMAEKKFKAALISMGSKSSEMTVEAMKNYFAEVDHLNIKQLEVNLSGKDAEILYEGKPLGRYDCLFAKGSFRYAPLLNSISSLLKGKTYMPIDPTAFTVVHDKLLTHLAMQSENLPMPRTYIAATPEAAKDIMKRMNFPIIMKFPQGTQGKGVVFADSYSSASSILDALTALRQPFILQEFVETGGTDVRAFVVGDQVVAAMQRKANAEEKRANLHAGGSAEALILDPVSQKIAVKAAKSVKAEICGVDILVGVRGPVVIEANISPGLQGITAATGIDIADKIAQHLFNETKKRFTVVQEQSTDEIMQSLVVTNTLMTTLDFRGLKVLLPEMITRQCHFKDDEMYEIKTKDGKLEITRMNIS